MVKCNRPDMHPISASDSRRQKQSTCPSLNRIEIVELSHVDGQVIVAPRAPIKCTIGLQIIGEDIKVLWNGSELFDGRSRWYKGKVVAFKPKTRKYLIHYRDGDKRWEKIFDDDGMLLSTCKMI